MALLRSRTHVALSVLAVVAAATGRAEPVTYTLTSGDVAFEIDAPLDTIRGVSRGVSGSATLDPAAWTAAPRATIDVDLASFRTGIDLRDEDLRDQFFETSRFAKATLELGGLDRATSPALVLGAVNEAVASATLSLHGVQRPVKIPLRVAADPGGQRVVVTGDFVVPLLDHGIQRPRRLVFKLGTDVKVRVRAVFRANTPTPSPTPGPAVASAPDDVAPFAPVVALPAERKGAIKPKPPAWKFAAGTAEGRGERAFVDAKIGGADNALSCRSCHATADPRRGIYDGRTVKPASTMWNAAARATLWQGLAPTPARAADICARLFMLRADGLDVAVAQDLDAYLQKLAPEGPGALPPLDWDVMHYSRRAGTALAARPDVVAGQGDRARGKRLVETHCKSCHDKGRVRPALEPGLYEGDMIVQRVRRSPGSDNQQMPPFTVTKLPDSELVDIAAYLVGDEKTRIFSRKRAQR